MASRKLSRRDLLKAGAAMAAAAVVAPKVLLGQSTPPQANESPKESPAKPEAVRREAGRTWIEGVPELRWGQSGECTFEGALSAALAVTPRPVSYADLMGLSGLAFRVRWFRRFDRPEWCPSSPVGEFSEEITATAAAIGWDIEQQSRMGQDDKDMSPYASAIRQSIEAGRPVVGYPDSDLNVAVAYGYEQAEAQTTFLWNAYGRSSLRVPAAKVGPWLMFLWTQGAPMEARPAMVQALSTPNWRRKSLPNWKPKPGQNAAYLYGQDALRTWREDIKQAEGFPTESRKSLFFVSWWCFDCLVDARLAAAKFLRSRADALGNEAKPALLRAADIYGRLTDLCAAESLRKHDAFFGPWSGKKFDDWSPEARMKEQEILSQIATLDAQSAAEFDKALAGNA